MNDKEQQMFNAIPHPPDGVSFRLREVRTIVDPHPFMITPRHVVIASDSFGGILGEAALEAAERKGIKCGWTGCTLSYSEHESLPTLMIEVPIKINRNLNEIEGLHPYLMSIKEVAETAGIKGFGFPTKEQR